MKFRNSQAFDATLHWMWALGLAAIAGFTLRLAFPSPDIWAAAPVAVVIWLTVLRGRGFWMGTLISLIASLAFWLTLIHWLTLYLGPLPWAALATLMALYQAIAGGLIAFVMRWVPRLWPSAVARLVLLPTLVASIWTARESFAATWPYGGFSWGRVAMSQTSGPFAELLSWVGATGVSWIVVALSVLLFESWSLWRAQSALTRTAVLTANQRLLASLAVIVGVLAIPAWSTTPDGSLRVLAVQGGADASLFSNAPAGTNLRAQITETLANAGESADVVVWPENASDLNPLAYPRVADALNTLSEQFNAPLVVGAIVPRDGQFFNTSLLWKYPEGLVDWYDKAHPVPFAEYMPDRAFWRPFAPELIDLIALDYQAGTRSNVFNLGNAKTGVAICFDITYDDHIQQMIDGGAQIIFAQTNNADFGRTDESLQQLAIARMRAFETGRPVVNISTVGTSALISGSGEITQQLPTWQPGSMVETMTLASGSTPANLLGRVPATASGIFAVFGTALVWAARPRAQRSRPRRKECERKVGTIGDDAVDAPSQ